MSSSSVVSLSSFNLLFFTQVLTVLSSTMKYSEYVTDKGKNISIPCIADGNIMWVKENGNSSTIVQTGKFLVLANVSTTDRGIYVCFAAVPPRNDDATDSALHITMSDDENGDTNNASATESAMPDATTSDDDVASATASTATQAANASATATTTSPTPKSAPIPTPLPMPTIIATAVNTSAAASSATKSALANSSDSSSSSTTPTTIQEQEFQAFQKVNLTVRTPPGPVTQLYFKASTILGFLIWRFNKTRSGGYPVRSFTAEFRNTSYPVAPYNSSFEHVWARMDPINIAPNVRQMEVYHLEPNTTYEFRIWANNQLGSGEMVTTNVTTLPETKEEDLIRLIQPDLDDFDPRIWIVAVSIVLGTLVILATGLCIVLSKECYQSAHPAVQDGWDSIELIPNIILNPGFRDSDGQETPYTRTIIFGDDSDSYESESDHEPRMEKFKRKVSVFFMGPTIHRI